MRLAPALAALAVAAPPGPVFTVAGTTRDTERGVKEDAVATDIALSLALGDITATRGGAVVLAQGALWRVGLDGTLRAAGRLPFSALADPAAKDDGGVLAVDPAPCQVNEFRPDGSSAVVAGNGTCGRGGDGGPATAAPVFVSALAALGGEGFLFADPVGETLRRVATDGTLSTLAHGVKPYGIAPLRDGDVLVVEQGEDRVRRVAPDGSVSPFAGTGRAGFSGDGGPAVSARLNDPMGAAQLTDGSVVIADTGNARVRQVLPDGSIRTVMGTGDAGPSTGGDGLPPLEAPVKPTTVVATADGGYLVADCSAGDQNCRARYIPGSGPSVRLGLALGLGYPQRGGGDIEVTVSAAAGVMTALSRSHRTVGTRRAQLDAGELRVPLPAVGAAGPYRIAATATTAGGRAEHQRTESYLGGRFTLLWGRRFSLHYLRDGYTRTRHGRQTVAVGRCRSMSRWRVDCELLSGTSGARPARCFDVLRNVVDEAGGGVHYRPYACASSPGERFVARPRFTGDDLYYSLGGLADAWPAR